MNNQSVLVEDRDLKSDFFLQVTYLIFRCVSHLKLRLRKEAVQGGSVKECLGCKLSRTRPMRVRSRPG